MSSIAAANSSATNAVASLVSNATSSATTDAGTTERGAADKLATLVQSVRDPQGTTGPIVLNMPSNIRF
jgi:hypothetical protein